MRAAGLAVRAVPRRGAVVRRVGLRARARAAAVRRRRRTRRNVALRFLDDDALAAMFRFSADMDAVAVEVNQLDNQMLVRYYESEWRRWQ